MNTVSTIRHFVAERLQVPDEQISVEEDLRKLGLDSIHALQIVLDVEQRYDIEIDDHIVFEAQNVRDFAVQVDELIAAQVAS
ncbi:acyl carrier protein [Amycolatopsis sp. NPDC023774]|uniref:acyl carrier protein n=1 Tax=Amycolatopsis sp. NPDC023774 TaxID=3155015 RepID=UPI0033C806DD